MLASLVAEMKQIVSEVKSPFSYIHDKLVEAFGHTHAEIEELKARVAVLEGQVNPAAGSPPPPPDGVEILPAPPGPPSDGGHDDHGGDSQHPGN